MRYLAIFAGIALLSCSSVLSAQPNTANFSGRWVLDTSKGVGYEATTQKLQLKPVSMKINESSNKLVIDAFRHDPLDGSLKMDRMAYNLDGSLSRNDADSVFNESHAKWSDNGNKLIITTKTSTLHMGREYSYDTVEVLSMQNGNLVVDLTYDNPHGKAEYEAVYQRKT